MAIEETTHLYEVLLRFGPGGIIGAHQRDLTRVVNAETGQIYSEAVLDPVPVTPQALAGLVDPLVPVLAAQAQAMAQLAATRAATIEAQAETIGALTTELQRAAETIAALTAEDGAGRDDTGAGDAV